MRILFCVTQCLEPITLITIEPFNDHVQRLTLSEIGRARGANNNPFFPSFVGCLFCNRRLVFAERLSSSSSLQMKIEEEVNEKERKKEDGEIMLRFLHLDVPSLSFILPHFPLHRTSEKISHDIIYLSTPLNLDAPCSTLFLLWTQNLLINGRERRKIPIAINLATK